MNFPILSKETKLSISIIVILVIILIIIYVCNCVLNKNKDIAPSTCDCAIPQKQQNVLVQKEKKKKTKKTKKLEKKQDKHKLCLYYADWCGHCQNFLPEWQKLKSKIVSSDLNKKIDIVEHNCETDKNICSKANVRGYPTVILHKNNGNDIINVPYEGARETEAIIEFISKEV